MRYSVLVSGLFLAASATSSAETPAEKSCPAPKNRPTLDSDLARAYNECHRLSFDFFSLINCVDESGNLSKTEDCQRRVATCEQDQKTRLEHQSSHDMNESALGDINGGWLGQSYEIQNKNVLGSNDEISPCHPGSKETAQRASTERDGIAQRHADIANEWHSWYQWAGQVTNDCRSKFNAAKSDADRKVAQEKSDAAQKAQEADRAKRQAEIDKANADKTAAQWQTNDDIYRKAVTGTPTSAGTPTSTAGTQSQREIDEAARQLGEAAKTVGDAWQQSIDRKAAEKQARREERDEADRVARARFERLQELPRGTIFIRTTPPGALVRVDGEPPGTRTGKETTPCQFSETPTRHEIVVRLAGYAPAKTGVRLGEAAGANVDLTLTPEVPHFSVRTLCKGRPVEVALDGRKASSSLATGPGIYEASAGNHSVVLSGKGCAPRTERVSIVEGSGWPVLTGDLDETSVFSGAKGKPAKIPAGRVTPGVGANGIVVGKSTMEDVRKIYGRTEESGSSSGRQMNYGSSVTGENGVPKLHPYTADFDPNGILREITYSGGGEFVTPGGALTEDDVLDEFGPDYYTDANDPTRGACCRSYRWDMLGIEILIDADDGTIISIDVFPPLTLPERMAQRTEWPGQEIFPGVGVDGVQVGIASIAEVRAAYGTACYEHGYGSSGIPETYNCRQDAGGANRLLGWDESPKGLPVRIDLKDGVVSSIEVSFYKYDHWKISGLDSCSPRTIEKAFGQPERRTEEPRRGPTHVPNTEYKYPSKGIDVIFNNNTCSSVEIYSPKK